MFTTRSATFQTMTCPLYMAVAHRYVYNIAFVSEKYMNNDLPHANQVSD